MKPKYTLCERGPYRSYNQETGHASDCWFFEIQCERGNIARTVATGQYWEGKGRQCPPILNLDETRALLQRMCDAANQEDAPDAKTD